MDKEKDGLRVNLIIHWSKIQTEEVCANGFLAKKKPSRGEGFG
jgi:hypothetical protein